MNPADLPPSAGGPPLAEFTDSGTRRAGSLRRRYILKVAWGYALLALAWIILSDQLLTAVVGVEAMVWLSSAKGFFFVLVSALAFFIALGGVPDRLEADEPAGDDAVARGLPEGWPVWVQHLLAAALVLAMLLLRWLISEGPGGRAMLVLFTLPISLAALLGGLGPGLTATGLAAALTGVFVLEPFGQPAIQHPHDQLQWFVLVGSGIVISLISESLRRSRQYSRQRLQELRASHAALVASEAQVKQLYDAAPVSMALVGWDGRILSLNWRFTQLFGYRLEDIPTLDDWWRLAYPDEAYRAEVRSTWDAQQHAGVDGFEGDQPGERHIRAADGRDLVVQISRRLMDQGLLTTFVDVTARHEAEDRLRLWAEAFAQAQVGLAVSDARSNRITAVNPAFARERGYEAQELAGKPISVLFPPKSWTTCAQSFRVQTTAATAS